MEIGGVTDDSPTATATSWAPGATWKTPRMLKQAVHGGFVAVSKVAAKLLPDRIPVTFVGANATAELAAAMRGTGTRRVLVVTDRVLRDLGVATRVADQVTGAGVDVAWFDGVTPDPTFDQIEAGLAVYQSAGCDAVLAVGGGSPMDAAKVIAAAATNGGNPQKLAGKFRVRRPPAPVFAVPTTAGTGSEVTIAAVVTDTETHLKRFVLDPKILPTMAALDPTLMTGLPAPITAATGMDALTHAIESYLSKAATPQTEAYATASVRLVFQHLRTAVSEPDNLDARSGMALASYYGGLAFTRTSVGYVHAIAHNLGARYGTPHGLANALALPHVLEFSAVAASDRLAELGALVGVSGSAAFIDAVRGLAADIGLPTTLDDLRIDDIGELADLALAEAFLDYPVPRYMTRDDCVAVISELLTPAVDTSSGESTTT